MRKILSFIATIAFLCACTQVELQVEQPGNPGLDPGKLVDFTLEATPVMTSTKTLNDGLSTRWETGDHIILMTAEEGTGNYELAADLTYDRENLFKGQIPSGYLEGVRDWYALYPYQTEEEDVNMGINPWETKALAGGKLAITLAQKTGTTQLQRSTGSKSHLAGPLFPMQATASKVSGQGLKMSMYHMNTVLKVLVTNDSEQPLHMKRISLMAPEAVTGDFSLDFDGQTTTLAAVSGKSSATAILELEEEAVLAKGEVAELYLAAKPFELPKGGCLTMVVNGTSRTNVYTDDSSFKANEIRTVKFNYTGTTGLDTDITLDPDPEILGKPVNHIPPLRNRYGNLLKEYKLHDGSSYYKVQREKALKTVLGNQVFNQYPDMKVPYKYVEDKIHKPLDYNKCSTVHINSYKKAEHTGADLYLDLVLPFESAHPTPFIVWIHGGGWQAGKPEAFTWESQFMASHGIAGVRVNYQLKNNEDNARGAWTNEEQLKDIADAVQYVKDHAAEFNIDPENYFFCGGSAGGHLAVMSGSRDRSCRGIIPLYAVYNIKGFYQFLIEVGQQAADNMDHYRKFWRMDSEEAYRKLNPCDVVTPGMPPMLIIHGTGDTIAPYIFCEEFMREMDRCGNSYQKHIFDGYDHSFTSLGASDAYETILLEMEDFISKHVRKPIYEF